MPNHIGYTTKTQPTLYWYVSKPVSAQFEFTLQQKTDPYSFDYVEPLVETTFYSSVNAGIHALSLARYNVRLEKGVEYTWSLLIKCDINNDSRNPVASGAIKYVAPSYDLSRRFNRTRATDLPGLYAQNGYCIHSII